ncbi:hypothetical protein HDU76_011418, partial [Blyttiomyces sp. JEL0837]
MKKCPKLINIRRNPSMKERVNSCPRRHLSGLLEILALSIEITRVAASFRTAIRIMRRSGREKSNASMEMKKNKRKWIVD